ncbi:hypothetical protein [Streptomyces sp. BA2]|uniref:hypothetical protein n=1 Tax=Streptomyces sp. BA2 TaxID=436595 RepID=UPI00132B8087|nr:hypothetical protein [Streptomyces sp. BA2]MWA14966.1 hypothetical protein [Streptomyces sp. BA2]
MSTALHIPLHPSPQPLLVYVELVTPAAQFGVRMVDGVQGEARLDGVARKRTQEAARFTDEAAAS